MFQCRKNLRVEEEDVHIYKSSSLISAKFRRFTTSLNHWTTNPKTSFSWLSNKLLKLKSVVFPLIRLQIQNGRSGRFWFDNWNASLNQMIALSLPRFGTSETPDCMRVPSDLLIRSTQQLTARYVTRLNLSGNQTRS